MSGQPEGRRTLVLVVGPRHSGTRTATGVLRRHDLHLPQPEVRPDGGDPRCTAEPQWVADLHQRLVAGARTMPADARPRAWMSTAIACSRAQPRADLRDRLSAEFTGADRVVVNDFRLAWFLPLWSEVAADLGVRTTVATVVRHPAAAVALRRRHDPRLPPDQHLLAGWVNLMTGIERLTRGAARVFLGHDELVRDWRPPLRRLGELAGFPAATTSQQHRVERFLAPRHDRDRLGWDAVTVGGELRAIAARAWDLCDRLTEPAGDTAENQRRLDEVRAEYAAYYGREEALVLSSIAGAEWRGRAQRPH